MGLNKSMFERQSALEYEHNLLGEIEVEHDYLRINTIYHHFEVLYTRDIPCKQFISVPKCYINNNENVYY